MCGVAWGVVRGTAPGERVVIADLLQEPVNAV